MWQQMRLLQASVKNYKHRKEKATISRKKKKWMQLWLSENSILKQKRTKKTTGNLFLSRQRWFTLLRSCFALCCNTRERVLRPLFKGLSLRLGGLWIFLIKKMMKRYLGEKSRCCSIYKQTWTAFCLVAIFLWHVKSWCGLDLDTL